MEKLIYTAMSGAQHTLMAQQIRANNLANVNTAGFRADFERVSAYALTGDGYQSRVMAKEEMAGTNFKAGPLMQTGRKLDVAIRGEGFLAVQTPDGKEAYTRAGNLEADADGLLTLNGRPVLGEGGELVLPAYRDISFGKDGTLSITPPGGGCPARCWPPEAGQSGSGRAGERPRWSVPDASGGGCRKQRTGGDGIRLSGRGQRQCCG